jgi:uncharacterized membrane protein (UPF0127 family)
MAGLTARNETRSTVLAERVEVGSSLWAKFWGLMGRRSLDAGTALWLPGENGIHMFFMRFPIDAVFVGRNGIGSGADSGPGSEGGASGGGGAPGVGSGGAAGVGSGGARRVVSVHRNLRPWLGIVPLVRGADGVIELPVGTIDATGTEPGDVVRIG